MGEVPRIQKISFTHFWPKTRKRCFDKLVLIWYLNGSSTCSVIDWTDFLLARWCNTPDEFLFAHFSIISTQCRWSSIRIRRDLDRALSIELSLGQTSLPNFLPRYSIANWLSTMSTPSTVIHGVLPMYGHYHNPSFSESSKSNLLLHFLTMT